jgi:hypothetical protein
MHDEMQDLDLAALLLISLFALGTIIALLNLLT